jgi:hypothetical protein
MRDSSIYVRDFIFWVGLSIAVAVGLLIIPGTDIIAWELLKPVFFWQKFLLIALEVMSLWGRVVLALLTAGSITAFTVTITE